MNQPGSAETSSAFTLSYDGQGIVDNSMDAIDFTGSIQAMHTLLVRSNQILNGKYATASLRIKVPGSGSVDANLLLFVSVSAVNFLSGDFITSAANLRQLLTGSPGLRGVIEAFKHLKGRPIDSSEQMNDVIRVSAKELRIDIPAKAFELFQDSLVRQALYGVYRPLAGNGIDKITIKDETGDLVSLDPTDVDFAEDSVSQNTDENVIDIPRQALTLVAPNLDDPHAKWRLSTGGRISNWYSIVDEDFLARVIGRDERFGSGDVLVANVRIHQKVSAERKISSEYTIVRVIDHHGREEQMPLL